MFTNLNRPTGLCSARRNGDTFYRAIVHRNCAVTHNDGEGYAAYDGFGPNYTVEDLPRGDRELTCELCGVGKSRLDYLLVSH